MFAIEQTLGLKANRIAGFVGTKQSALCPHAGVPAGGSEAAPNLIIGTHLASLQIIKDLSKTDKSLLVTCL